MTYFLDANIISYVIKNIPSVISRIQDLIKDGADVRIPIVSYYEVKRGLLANKASNKLAIFDTQIKALGLVQMTEQTFDLAALIYSQLKQSGNLIDSFLRVFFSSISIILPRNLLKYCFQSNILGFTLNNPSIYSLNCPGIEPQFF